MAQIQSENSSIGVWLSVHPEETAALTLKGPSVAYFLTCNLARQTLPHFVCSYIQYPLQY